jgi:glycerol-3-phosphate acyltransferase PlsX
VEATIWQGHCRRGGDRGFTGNIALKTAEGTAKQIGEYLRSAMSRTLMAKIGYLFAKKAFDALRERWTPAR